MFEQPLHRPWLPRCGAVVRTRRLSKPRGRMPDWLRRSSARDSTRQSPMEKSGRGLLPFPSLPIPGCCWPKTILKSERNESHA